ncbi:MAG: hypothetical protein JXB13_16015 [Phycisphaerae bacterium]|nr:hypothetical protein [Phycisphaerae bacterium]
MAIGNRELAKHLAASATLSAIEIGLLDYRVTVQGLRVNQPDGFGGGLLLDLPEARVTLVLSSLFGLPLTIEEVTITDLSLHVLRRKDGTLNVVRLLQTAAADPGAAAARKPVHIRRITVENLTIRYTDLAWSEEPVDATIHRLDAVITDVVLDMAGNGDHPFPGRAEMTGFFVQPGFSDAPLGIIARFGRIDTGRPVPAAHAATRLAGLELQPWRALLPRGLSQAIGGDIIDVNVDAAISSDALDCTVAIVTPAGDALKLKLDGTPRRPLVEQDSIRGIVTDRAKEAGLNTLGNMGDAGAELGRTALSSAATAGKGAATTVWGTVTGLFTTASSASKGNLATSGADLWGTMRTAVTNTGDMVGDTGASLMAGGVQTVSSAGGGDRNELWRADTQRRWARNWEQARKSVEESSAADPGTRRLTDDEHPADLP